jgi:DNA modification methylase
VSYATAYRRWSGVGPYYAMFPVSFADQVIQRYTTVRQRILDPFAGRASSIFAAAAHGRTAVGIEINPVGWIYGATKLRPGPREAVERRVRELVRLASDFTADIDGDLAAFFQLCFAPSTRKFLKACREHLDWKHNHVDRTLMTLILIDLHGRRDRSFSNQMSQSKAMSPDYSVRWWKEQGLVPPERNIEDFLLNKIAWRYAKGTTPIFRGSTVMLGDSCENLEVVQEHTDARQRQSFHLLFTSPPYMGVTDYHRDQWLRLWMLGGNPSTARLQEKHRGMFASHEIYRELLSIVFEHAADMMSARGVVYVRTDARSITFETTQQVLRTAFPRWRETIIDQPAPRRSQTARFGDSTQKPGEKDIILTGPQA